ncbi:1-acyl-sn-glycerol-3-phosphate acyltransferase [Formosa sp. A9]|uniref:1-acyl-sn-glycerol-3-phosphate acyltransferase n=1 Tax=Formosa sp. A9 TaxID=3442641 RepID=UPI003EBDCE09
MRFSNIGLSIVRSYVALGLYFNYKKIQVRGKEHVPENKPVLFLSNHQNALMDALIIATKSGRFCYYLTRASVFQKPVIARILKRLRMLPVYRVRDGWQTISNNNDIFKRCTTLLHDNEAIVIFPEGNHSLKRKVRPLSKGFTRLVFETLDAYPNIALQLLPVGVNYQNAKQYGDSMLLQIGQSLVVNKEFLKDRKQVEKELKITIQNQIQQLTTHISSPDYDSMAHRLHKHNANFLNPEQVNYYIEQEAIIEGFEQKPTAFLGLKSLFKYALILNVFPVYWLWKLVLRPKIKEDEFMATFRFAWSITLVPMYLLLVAITLGLLLGWHLALGWLLTVLTIALLAVKL